MGHHRFNPEKAARLDAPERLEREPPERIVDALALEAGQVLLDLGAGTGTYALPAARRLAELGGGRVLAADVEPRMLALVEERAREQGVGGIGLLPVGGAPPYPLMDNSVDLVLLVHVLHELDDPAASLAALHQALRPGGSVLLVDWDPAHPGEHGPPADHRVPLPEAISILEGAGFEAVEVLDLLPADSYTLRARRC